MDKKYMLCYVTDYRGGELNYETGLDEKTLIEKYFDPYVDYIMDDYTDEELKAMSVADIVELIADLDEDECVYSAYAGGSGTSFPIVFEVIGRENGAVIEEGGPDNMDELGAKYIYDVIQKTYEDK